MAPKESAAMHLGVLREYLSDNWNRIGLERGLLIANGGPSNLRLGVGLLGIDQTFGPGQPVQFHCMTRPPTMTVIQAMVMITGIRMEEDHPDKHALEDTNYLFWGWLKAHGRGERPRQMTELEEPIRVAGEYNITARRGSLWSLEEPLEVTNLRIAMGKGLMLNVFGPHKEHVQLPKFPHAGRVRIMVPYPGECISVGALFELKPCESEQTYQHDDRGWRFPIQVSRLVTMEGKLVITPRLYISVSTPVEGLLTQARHFLDEATESGSGKA